jgi:hypothetical protein
VAAAFGVRTSQACGLHLMCSKKLPVTHRSAACPTACLALPVEAPRHARTCFKTLQVADQCSQLPAHVLEASYDFLLRFELWLTAAAACHGCC